MPIVLENCVCCWKPIVHNRNYEMKPVIVVPIVRLQYGIFSKVKLKDEIICNFSPSSGGCLVNPSFGLLVFLFGYERLV